MDWFDALEKRANLNNKGFVFDWDYAIAALFIVFLALCAADIV